MRPFRTTLFLFATCLLIIPVDRALHAQVDQPSISFVLRNVSLRTALDSLINQHNLQVLYLDKEVEGKSVTTTCQQCSIETAMDRLLENTSLTWRREGKQIIVFGKREDHSRSMSTISGTVADSITGEALIGATVMVYGIDTLDQAGPAARGTATNKFGFFSIPGVPSGRYTILVRSLGHAPRRFAFEVEEGHDAAHLDLRLMEEDIHLQEIIVEGHQGIDERAPLGSLAVAPAFIKQLPSLGGEIDLFRSLQLLPGIKAVSELSSGLYIRGGSPDQNLTLLDGVVVYNPSHLGGFLSTFNTDAINSIRVFKGGFPAEYGGRISSVVDLVMREGTKERISGSAGISLISSRLTLEGPFTDKSSFMISGRRMYLDLLLPLFDTKGEAPRYYFYDLNTKLNYAFSPSDHVYVSGYFGRDVLHQPPKSEDSNFDIAWGNLTGNLRWTHIVSPRLFLGLSAVLSDYDFATLVQANYEFSGLPEFDSQSRIRDAVIRVEAQYFPDEFHALKTGIELTHHAFEVSASDVANASIDRYINRTRMTSVELTAFAQDEWRATPPLSLTLGIRGSYSSDGDYVRFEPRASASYSLSDALTLKGSLTMVHQFLHLLVRNNISLPTDVWFPSNATLLPEQSVQASAGVEQYFGDGQYMFTAEAYYKAFQNLYDYRDDAQFSLGIPLETQLTRGSGDAYGVELFLNKRLGSLTGWIGYTLAWTKRRFPDLNGGREFYPRFDRRHDLSAVLTLRLGESWEMGATWTYGTGQAYTMPTGQYGATAFGGLGSPLSGIGPLYATYDYAERNGYRLPPFHKLDVSFIHKYSWFGLPFQVSLNIYNVYNRRNPFIENLLLTPSGGYPVQPRVQLERISLFPILPTIGLSVKF